MATPLMGLDIPTAGAGGTEGPLYATQLVSAFDKLDSHDHAPGNGAQIGVAGLSIDADLGVGAFNIQNIRSLRLNNQTAALGDPNDLRNLYSVNGDLFFNDGAANQIRLTASGALNAASIGGIGGDYETSNASVSYSDTTKVFSFTQDSGITAKMAFGDILLSENVVSAPAITIKSPVSLAGAYSLTLFAGLPSDDLATNAVSLTAAGIFATTQSPIMVLPQIRDTSKDHSYIFAVAELTANRTVSLPLLIAADTFVFEAHIQTLTNKTIDAATYTGISTVSGTIDVTNTDDSTSPTTGSIQTDGGIGIVKALWVGGLTDIAGALNLQSTLDVAGLLTGTDVTDSTNPTTGAFKTAGGLGVVLALWVGGLTNIAGVTTLQAALVGTDVTDSTSPTTGAFKTAGGLGVAKALWVGGLADIAGAVNLQTTLGVTGIATFTAGGIFTAEATLDAGAIFDDQGATPATPATGDGHLYQRANNARATKLAGGELSTVLFWEDEQGLIGRPGEGFIELDDANHDFSLVASPEIPRRLVMTPTALRTVNLNTLLVPIGFDFIIWNAASAFNIDVTPSDKATIYTILPGTFLHVIASVKTPTTGAHWFKAGGAKRFDVHTATGSFTVPAFVHRLKATVIGGGGGGEGSTSAAASALGGGGGAAGATAIGFVSVVAGDADTITVGAGGAAGASAGGNGGAGVNSVFKGLTGVGGPGGGGAGTGRGGIGVIATGGDINIIGGDGTPGVQHAEDTLSQTSAGGSGGSSYFGGAGAGGVTISVSEAGAANTGGGGGGAGANTIGGGANSAASAGGAGIIILEY